MRILLVFLALASVAAAPVPDLMWDRLPEEDVVSYHVMTRETFVTPYDCLFCVDWDFDTSECLEEEWGTCYLYTPADWVVLLLVPQTTLDHCPEDDNEVPEPPWCVKIPEPAHIPADRGFIEYCVRGVDEAGNVGTDCPEEGAQAWMHVPNWRKKSKESTVKSLVSFSKGEDLSKTTKVRCAISGDIEESTIVVGPGD
jgi:hypothetical protein